MAKAKHAPVKGSAYQNETKIIRSVLSVLTLSRWRNSYMWGGVLWKKKHLRAEEAAKPRAERQKITIIDALAEVFLVLASKFSDKQREQLKENPRFKKFFALFGL